MRGKLSLLLIVITVGVWVYLGSYAMMRERAIFGEPTPTAAEPSPSPFARRLPETCILPSRDNPPKVTIGRIGRNGQIIDCSLKAFRELFPGCGNPSTNPEDFSNELFEAWLAANGYDVESLADTNNDGILDPIVYPNQVLIGYWQGGLWSQ